MKLEDFKDEKSLRDYFKEDKPYFVSQDHLGNTVIVELPSEFRTHDALFNSREYKDFVEKKHKEEEEKRKKERDGKSIFDMMHNGILQNGIIITAQQGMGKSFFSYVEDFVRDYNIKKRKEIINKILNK
jgi:hypothetical protein